jgi:hypothetical protein
MARLFDGANDSLQATIDLTGDTLVTLAFWLWWDAYGTDNDLCFEFPADGTTVGAGGFAIDPNAGGGNFYFWQSGTGGDTQGGITRPSAAATRRERHHPRWHDGHDQARPRDGRICPGPDDPEGRERPRSAHRVRGCHE